jgi:hypothetical protein
MSQLSHANSYRATNRRELQAIYNHIDRLEKTEVKIRRNAIYHPLFQWPLLAACGLLAVEIVLAHTRYRRCVNEYQQLPQPCSRNTQPQNTVAGRVACCVLPQVAINAYELHPSPFRSAALAGWP